VNWGGKRRAFPPLVTVTSKLPQQIVRLAEEAARRRNVSLAEIVARCVVHTFVHGATAKILDKHYDPRMSFETIAGPESA
jgi:hypothetical protein